MKHHKSIVIVTLIACVAIGGIAATEIQDPFARRVQTLETQVKSLLRRVEDLEKQKLGSTYPKWTDLAKRVTALEKRKPAIATPKGKPAAPPAATSFSSDLAVGQIAYLGRANNARVEDIIDGTNMVVEITVGYKSLATRSPGLRFNESRFLTGVRSGGPQEAITKTVWIKGLNTAGLVDRSEVKSPGPLKITGTTSYTKWSDKTTLFVLEPVVDNR